MTGSACLRLQSTEGQGCTLNGELLKDSLIFVDFLRGELAVCLTYRLQGFCKFFQSRSR